MSERSVTSIIRTLDRLSRRWLDRRYFFRKKAVLALVRDSGFTEMMAQALLDDTFRELTASKLTALLKSELGDPRVLDEFRPDKGQARQVRVHGPESILHVFSANIPNAAVWSFGMGMLLKSRNVGKLSSRDRGFLGLYLTSLKTVDPKLSRTNVLLDPSDRRVFESALKKASLVVAYGSDEGLRQIQTRVPVGTPFFGYGHRVSLGLFGKKAMSDRGAADLAKKAARDVWSVDQRGCLSPLTFYVQKGGIITPRQWAALLAAELGRLQTKDKKSPRRAQEVSLMSQSRAKDRYLLGKVRGKNVGWWESRPAGLWAVRYEEELSFLLTGGAQTIAVKGFDRVENVFQALNPAGKYLQAVSLEPFSASDSQIAEPLSRLGVSRICRSGKMQSPPLLWHHDGKPNLSSWVRWTDWECDKISR